MSGIRKFLLSALGLFCFVFYGSMELAYSFRALVLYHNPLAYAFWFGVGFLFALPFCLGILILLWPVQRQRV
jgi:hypothetical protein